VNVQIRGINSLNYNQQPLYVVDGIMIRNDGQNGAAGANNGNFWDDQRIRGNGILDINPADIASLTVLKGASATALYGSDAASGVIVITTKKGTKGKGLGVGRQLHGQRGTGGFSAQVPERVRPGYDRATNVSAGANAEGWIPRRQFAERLPAVFPGVRAVWSPPGWPAGAVVGRLYAGFLGPRGQLPRHF
jgi:iron complex outermembrane receptor protein